MLTHLAQLLALAQAHGLRVQLTLFDWWNSYGDLTGSRQWVRAVLAPYAHDPRIAFIELQNEMDPGNSGAMSWARQMIPFVRSVSGGIPLTVSVSSHLGTAPLRALPAALQGTLPDFAEFHYYEQAELAFTLLQQAKQAAAPLPLYIGETGFSCALSNEQVSGLPAAVGAREAYQDYYYRVVQHAAATLGLPLVALWTFTDFAPGSLSWVPPTSTEYSFGLYRVDGSARPIAASVAAAFGSGSVDTSFNAGFESCGAGLPAIWLLYHPSQARFACDATVAHNGSASTRISNCTGDASGVPAFFLSPPVAGLVSPRTCTRRASGRAAGRRRALPRSRWRGSMPSTAMWEAPPPRLCRWGPPPGPC
jgi:hypothetical protein